MYDEEVGDYDEDVSGGTVFCHDRGGDCCGRCSEKNTGKGCAMKKIKTIEILLSAVYVLIAAALSVVKFIKQIDKLKTATA